MPESALKRKIMFSRLFSLISLILLITNASLASANQAGSSWFGFQQENEAEYEPYEVNLQPPLDPQQRSAFNQQVLQRLKMEKQRNAASLTVQLIGPLDAVTVAQITNNWKNLLAGLQIQIETFASSPDRIMIRLVNSGAVNDVKNLLLDDPKVALVTIEQQVFSGSAALQQQMLEFEAERLEQQQELAEEVLERQMLAKKAQMFGFGGGAGLGGLFGAGQHGQNQGVPAF